MDSVSESTTTYSAPADTTETESDRGLRPGTAAHRRALIALVAAGLASFNAMYATQGLLPSLTEQLHVTPSAAALSVSAVTGMLALTIIPASVLSERFGRGRVMILSGLSATALGLVLALAPNLPVLVIGRALQGILVAGVPAVAMAWIAEEMHPDALGDAMGRYVAGTTVGGLLGRLVPGAVTEFAPWHVGMAATALLAFIFAIITATMLPRQRFFSPKRITLRGEFQALIGHWRDRRIAGLFILGFLLMGTFVSVYNYLGFRLRSDYGFSDVAIGLVFLLYLVGTYTSARAGALADRFGRLPVIVFGIASVASGVALTLLPWLVTCLLGVAVLTGGLFIAHSTASSWVGALAVDNRAEASSTYLCCYYLGSSALGYSTGFPFHHGGWAGLVFTLFGLLALAALVATAVGFAVRRQA